MIFRKFALWLGITKYGEWKGGKMEKSLLGVQVMLYGQYSSEDELSGLAPRFSFRYWFIQHLCGLSCLQESTCLVEKTEKLKIPVA